MIRFEWDPVKARTNQRKHGVTFDDAMHVFDDPHALFEEDRAESEGEIRWQSGLCNLVGRPGQSNRRAGCCAIELCHGGS